MTSSWNKLQLLLWKNWTIQKRHYIQTIFEILIPVLCCSMLILVRGLVDPEKVDHPTIFNPLAANSYSDLKYFNSILQVEVMILSSSRLQLPNPTGYSQSSILSKE